MDDRLAAAIELFNTREFFACHDVLEEIWSETLSEDRTFYQGLIHAAVALYHFSEGNHGGARKMYGSARRYLSPYAPVHANVAVGDLLADLQTCFADLMASTAETVAGVPLPDNLIPVLRVESAAG